MTETTDSISHELDGCDADDPVNRLYPLLRRMTDQEYRNAPKRGEERT